ncbi:thiamine pyrophosphate-dependent enzyme [Pseudorhodoplanes sp.]|uniref:thiamine pyrophosphate-dependent enzyme n=1 Tax=Pseudorhodoplanes sp. TaxID=1934341 RepID=UPI002C00B6C0|nr:thiamine pyrophosphate-dependent enzyme [Pseudorhodoplanes sp.]HWV51488.1 thiamine pyrophosphate-dependent enzyme [Pseudorhodoplanes sp.]
MAEALKRREVVAALMSGIEDELIVCGLGSPISDVMSVRDRPLNFYLMGAMGLATSVGLGLALAQPERSVIVITGDAELMMNSGALATIGVRKPRNLSVVVLDNERFGETGEQISHTSAGVDIAGIAIASGFGEAETVRDKDQIESVRQRMVARTGPYLAVVKIKAERSPVVMPPKSGVILKSRFRQALLGQY